MGEYRERTTGEVKSQGEWRAAFPKMALPRVWGANVCDAMNIDPVLPSPAATTTAYQVSVRDGVELDAEAAASVRAQRDELLAKSDWVTIRAKELGQDVPLAWYNYRGDLRQIPEQDGFPHDVTFPTEPS